MRAEVVARSRRMPSLAEWRTVLRDPALAIWVLFLLLSPVYVISSGLPQPGDWLVLLLAPFALARWNGRLDRAGSLATKALLLFCVWVCVVNWGWAVMLGKYDGLTDFVLVPLFYIFNGLVFLSGLIIARRNPERFLRITVDAVFITIIACVIASIGSTDRRATVFFNGPNQLGFYALLAASLIAITQRPCGIGRLKASVGVTACAYLALLSSSRAALAGILMLLVVLLVSDPRIIIIGALASIGLVTLESGPIADALHFNQKRAFEDRDPSESFAEERGYDRIWRFPQHLALGAGEGAYDRFARPGRHMRELHSSFGSLLFSYGVIGIGLFLLFFVRVIRGAPIRSILMLVPVLSFTVAHQGLRFTSLWVVFAVFAVLKTLPERPRARAVAHP